MKKALLTTLLALVLLLTLMTGAALAAAPPEGVWIYGLELDSDEPYYKNGASGEAGTLYANETAVEAAGGWNAYYDVANGILYLDELTVTNSSTMITMTPAGASQDITFGYAIYANVSGGLTIDLSEASDVSVANNAAPNSVAIFIVGDLEVKGSGSLTATGGTATGVSEGVDVSGAITVSNGTLTGTGGSASSMSAGVYGESGVTVTGGTLTGNGDTATNASGQSYGVTTYRGDITVSGGTLIGTGGKATGSYGESYGVWATNITASGGTLTGTGDEAPLYSYGVSASNYGTITISDSGALTGTGGAAATSWGVLAYNGSIAVSGGRLTANGGAATGNVCDSIGVSADNIEVTDGALTGIGGVANGGDSTSGPPFEGGSSFGVSAATVTLSGGSLSGTGNTTTGYFNVSYGVYVNALTVSDGTLEATGGAATSSCGVFSYGVDGEVIITGGEFKAIGGAATGTGSESYGVATENTGAITVNGGALTAKTTDAAGDNTDRMALRGPFTMGPGVAAQASLTSDGTDPFTYVPADNNTYLWVQTAYTPVPVSPSQSSDSGSTSYRLTFDTNGGEKLAAISGKRNTVIDLDDYTPVREGYIFDGWYADEDLTQPIDEIKLAKSVTVYAKWTEKTRLNPFIDVKQSDWFYNDVLSAYEDGLVNGRTANTFVPRGSVTIAEAVKLAACINQLYVDGEVSLTNGRPHWYDPYVDYAIANGIITAGQFSDYNAIATRAQFAEIFAHALPASVYTVIKEIADGDIPDVKLSDSYGPAVYQLYRAGILKGNDALRTFAPNSDIKRSEVAAIVNRMMQSYVK